MTPSEHWKRQYAASPSDSVEGMTISGFGTATDSNARFNELLR